MNVKNAHIMVVDDEPVNLKLLDRLLKNEGYSNLTLISDPREVINHYHRQTPDIILLDINMPYLDGYDVMAQLTELNDELLPPIVVLTAQHGKEFLLKALDAGARDYLCKPFDGVELAMRIRNLLEAQLNHRLLHDKKQLLESLVDERTQELQNSRLEIIKRLGMAAEYKDEETGNHVLRMSHISSLLAEKAGLSEEECKLVLLASPMHDIGKIGIPDEILLKPGKLDAREWAIMKSHVFIGEKLLDDPDNELLKAAKEIALTHHEKWDGTGYPYGLKGEEIPIFGRLAALADVFDALTSERPYKRAWSVDEAVELIKAQRGLHFDPTLVDIFIAELPQILAIKHQFAEPQ